MSYMGMIRPLLTSLTHKSKLSVLEIGIEKGYSSFGIIQNLIKNFTEFTYVGLDIKLDSNFTESLSTWSGFNMMTKYHGKNPVIFTESGECKKNVLIYEENSLSWLARSKDTLKFDLVFVDGDHNYFTVSNELEKLKDYCDDNTLIICDDYTGRYSTKDQYYSAREDYKDVKIATKLLSINEKSGVKTAIDDFISINNKYAITNFQGVPWCIVHNSLIKISAINKSEHARDCIFTFKTDD